MAMYDKTPTQETSEPDLLDFLAQWSPVIFDILSAAETTLSLPASSEPETARRLMAVERAVLRLETVQQRQATWCANIASCVHHRCRRRKRCSKLERITSTLAAARAFIAARRARGQPPPKADDYPTGRNTKGRTGARP